MTDQLTLRQKTVRVSVVQGPAKRITVQPKINTVRPTPTTRQVRVVNDLAGIIQLLNSRFLEVLENGNRQSQISETTTGSTTDYILRTYGTPITELYDGLGVWLTPHLANAEGTEADPVTIRVDSTPSKPLLLSDAYGISPLPADTLRMGIATVIFWSEANDAWLVGSSSAYSQLQAAITAYDQGAIGITSIQSLISDIKGQSEASYALRVKNGTEGAELELVAFSDATDPDAPTSLARISADDIILDGTVTAPKLDVAGSVSALGLTVAAADITDTLEVGQIPSLPQSRIENLTSDISNAQSTADAAATAAASRVQTFSQDTEPTATAIGDLWHDTTNNKFYRWSGSSWVSVAITADSVAADWVYAGQVSAAQVSATSLDAISSNLGSIQVGFANIEDGAVTNQFAAVTASSLTITDNYQEVQSLQIDCAGNPVSLTFSANVGYYLKGKVEIRVDGVVQEEIDFSPDMDTDSMSFSFGGSAYFTMGWPVTNTYSTVLNLAAGQHTISIRAKKTQNDSITSGPYIKKRFLQTLELKR